LDPSARLPSSCIDDANEEANICLNDDVAIEDDDIRTSAVMTDAEDDEDDDNVDDGNFTDTLGEIIGISSIASPALDLDDALGAVDSTVDFDRTPLVSPPSPPLTSPPFSSVVREPTGPGIQKFALS